MTVEQEWQKAIRERIERGEEAAKRQKEGAAKALDKLMSGVRPELPHDLNYTHDILRSWLTRSL